MELLNLGHPSQFAHRLPWLAIALIEESLQPEKRFLQKIPGQCGHQIGGGRRNRKYQKLVLIEMESLHNIKRNLL